MAEITIGGKTEKELQNYSLADLDLLNQTLEQSSESEENKSKKELLDSIILGKLQQMASQNTMSAEDIEYAQKYIYLVKNEELRASIQQNIDAAVDTSAKENNVNDKTSSFFKKDELIAQHLDNIQLFDGDEVSAQFKDMSPALNNIDFTDEENNSLEDEIQREYLKALFEASKLETHRELLCDKECNLNYLTSNDESFLEKTIGKIKNIFTAKIAQAGIASTYRDGKSVENADKEAAIFMEKLSAAKGKMKIKSSQVEIACADTDTNVSTFCNVLKNKFSGKNSKLSESLKKFQKKTKNLFGKTYEVTRAVVKNVKANKWQHIGNTVATGGMWAATLLGAGASVTVAGAAVPVVGLAVGSYALYSAAGGYVWPVVAEAQKLRTQAKENNKKMGFWSSIKAAWKNKQNDKTYKARARWGIVGGVVGAGLGFGGFSMGIDTIAAKTGALLARSASSMAAQTTAYLYAKKDYAKDSSEENLAKLKFAKVSLGIGALISGVSAYLSLDNMSNANEAAQNVAENTVSDNSGGVKEAMTDSLKTQKLFGKVSVHPDDLQDTSSVVQTTNNDASAIVNTTSAPIDAQAGVEIVKEKTFNGVKEIHIKDENGNIFAKYEGLKAGIDPKVSDATYEKLIDNINAKGNINFTMKDGSLFSESVDIIRSRIANGTVTIPEEMHPNHAIYLALMDARYTGDLSLLNDLKCGDGLDLSSRLISEANNYSTNGHIGTPITDEPLPLKAGRASEITKACAEVNHLGLVGGRDAAISGGENDVISEKVTKSVAGTYTPKEASALATSTFRGSKHDYAVDLNSISGKVMDVETKDGDFYVRLYDKDGAIVLGEKGADGKPLISGADTGLEVVVKNPSEEFLKNNISKIPNRFQDEINSYINEINAAKAAANTIIETKTQEIASVSVDIGSDMKEQIADNGNLGYFMDGDNRRYMVSNVEGLSRFSTENFASVNMENASVSGITSGENSSYTVNIATEDKQNLQVVVTPKEATVLLNGKDVVLDEKTALAVETLTEKALENKNVKVDLDLNSAFNEKLNRSKEITNPMLKVILQNLGNKK